MDYSDASTASSKVSSHTVPTIGKSRIKEHKTRSITPVELIQAVKYAMHTALNKPWLQLDIPGPPECCELRLQNVMLQHTQPNSEIPNLFKAVISQELWIPAFTLFDIMISNGKIPHPCDVQKILLLIVGTKNTKVIEKALESIQMLFRSWPPCCLHMGAYYKAVFRSLQKDGQQESNGLLFTMIEVFCSQLNCQVELAPGARLYSAAVLKVVVSALAADLASWRSRYQMEKHPGSKHEKPLAEIALGQVADTQIHVCDFKDIVKICVRGWKKMWIPALQHEALMDLVHLVAEVFQARGVILSKDYPSLGAECHLLASEIASQIEFSGMETESIGQFLCVLKPSWLSMLVGQKLLEKLQGPLRSSVIDTVISYLLEYQEFVKREGCCTEHYGNLQGRVEKANMKKVNKRDHKGEVQLHRSCRRGNVDAVHRLLADPSVDVNICDNAGWTPLHEAVYYGHFECVQALLNFIPHPGSAYINTAARADCGTTPLICAADAGNADMCHLLLQHSGSVLLEDVLEGNDVKPELKHRISEEMQSLLKTAKLQYENIIGKHIGVSLSEKTWTYLNSLLVPLIYSQLSTYYVPLVRRQFGLPRDTAHSPIAHVKYSAILQIMRVLRSFEKLRKVVKQLSKQPQLAGSAVRYFQSYE